MRQFLSDVIEGRMSCLDGRGCAEEAAAHWAKVVTRQGEARRWYRIGSRKGRPKRRTARTSMLRRSLAAISRSAPKSVSRGVARGA